MLIMPDGNQYPFIRQADGTFINSTIPSLRGAVMTSFGALSFLRLKDGLTFRFGVFPAPGGGAGFIAGLDDIRDPNGNEILLAYDNFAKPMQITRIIDPNFRILTLNYDTQDRITSVVDPIGRTVSYTYNSQGTLETITDPTGNVTRYDYDSQNRLTNITDRRGVVVAQDSYDANGRVIQQIQADGGIIKFAYTLLNPLVPTSPVLITSVTDAMGNTTTYHFDPTGLLLDVTDPTGQTRVFSRDVQHNNLVSSVKGGGTCPICGNTTIGELNFTYDANGNVATRTDALGNTTTYTYEPVFNKVTLITDPLGNIFKYTYDSSGNMVTATDPNGHTTSNTYNSAGQRTETTDALGQKTTFSYSAQAVGADLISITDQLGNKTLLAYDSASRPVAIVDALGKQTTVTYDALDHVVILTNPQGNTIHVNYDPVGNLLTLADPNRNMVSFTYDARSRISSRVDAYNKTDTRSYDYNSNLVKFVDRRGQTSSFEYDSLNRLKSQTYQDGSKVTWLYDAGGRLVQALDSMAGTFDFSYNLSGYLSNSATPFGALQYSYDTANRVIARKGSGQVAVTYSYDAAGNLLSVSMPQAAANFSYDARDQLVKLTRSNGITSRYTYDMAKRLLSISHSGGEGIQIALTYAYDPVGNRSLFSTNVVEPQAVSNKFDAGYRLVQSGTASFTYDDNGNLTSMTDSGGATTYSWDSRNRLVSTAAPSGQMTAFLYDFAGNLIARTDSGPMLNLVQRFVLDDITNLAYVNRGNGETLSVLAGRSIDQHIAVVRANGQVEYGLEDAINSTVDTADQNGQLVSSFLYEPFGKTTTTGVYPFQFTGRVPINSSLYYYRARYYSPCVGRFISEDPLGVSSGDALLYRYSANSPVNLTDASGLQGLSKERKCQAAVAVVTVVVCAFASDPASKIACGGSFLSLALTCSAGPLGREPATLCKDSYSFAKIGSIPE
jgi:RHS repeat-associated protein